MVLIFSCLDTSFDAVSFHSTTKILYLTIEHSYLRLFPKQQKQIYNFVALFSYAMLHFPPDTACAVFSQPLLMFFYSNKSSDTAFIAP